MWDLRLMMFSVWGTYRRHRAIKRERLSNSGFIQLQDESKESMIGGRGLKAINVVQRVDLFPQHSSFFVLVVPPLLSCLEGGWGGGWHGVDHS